MNEAPSDREFVPLADLAAQLKLSLVGARRMAVAGKIPGAFRLGARWFVSLPTFRRSSGVADATDDRRAVASPAPPRLGRPRALSDLDRVYSSGYTRDTVPGRA